MKNLIETIKYEVKTQMEFTNFAVNENNEVMINGKAKFQVLPEEVAETVLDDFKNYDGFKAVNFDFEGVTYYFVKQ